MQTIKINFTRSFYHHFGLTSQLFDAVPVTLFINSSALREKSFAERIFQTPPNVKIIDTQVRTLLWL